MNVPLPEICCPECHLRQSWRGQNKCIHCTKEMPAYNIASQVYQAQAKAPAAPTRPPTA